LLEYQKYLVRHFWWVLTEKGSLLLEAGSTGESDNFLVVLREMLDIQLGQAQGQKSVLQSTKKLVQI